MTNLEAIDWNENLRFIPCQMDLEDFVLTPIDSYKPVENIPEISLHGDDLVDFMSYITASGVLRGLLESHLQCISRDNHNALLLTTWIPLVTMQHDICCCHAICQNNGTQRILKFLYTSVKGWRSAGVDIVEIVGYLKK